MGRTEWFALLAIACAVAVLGCGSGGSGTAGDAGPADVGQPSDVGEDVLPDSTDTGRDVSVPVDGVDGTDVTLDTGPFRATSAPVHLVLPLGFPQSFVLPGGLPYQRVETYNATVVELFAPGSIGVASLRVVPAEVLEYVTFSTDEPPTGVPPEPASVSVRIGPMSMEDTVCADGDDAGSVSFALNSVYQPTGETEPTELEAPETALGHMNELSFSACYTIEVPVDGTLTLTHLPVWAEIFQDCDALPMDMFGHWEGTYSCTNTCGEGESGDVSLEITQDGVQASYTDEAGASYAGAVCGSSFVFAGGVEGGDGLDGYFESGQLTVIDEETATKSSWWTSGTCGGLCTDQLHR